MTYEIGIAFEKEAVDADIFNGTLSESPSNSYFYQNENLSYIQWSSVSSSELVVIRRLVEKIVAGQARSIYMYYRKKDASHWYNLGNEKILRGRPHTLDLA